jgi:hypothetical protein
MAFFFAVRNGSGPSLRWTTDRIDAVAAELHEPAARCAGYVVPVTPSATDECGVFGITLHSGRAAPQSILDVLAQATPDLEFSAPAATAQGPFQWPTPGGR